MNTNNRRADAAERYDRALKRGSALLPVPDGCPEPRPTCDWPVDNVDLLERYRTWLEEWGAAQSVIEHHRIPTAGHVLGLNLKPHWQLDLGSDLEKVMTYLEDKQVSHSVMRNYRHSLAWFHRFLLLERGEIEMDGQPAYGNAERYQSGLPDWLLAQLEQLLHVRQAGWRPSRMAISTYQFWYRYTRVWRWLFAQEGVKNLIDIKREHIYTYIDIQLTAGYAIGSINIDIRTFRAILCFLQERGFQVPQALFHISGLKKPDSLPRFLTDEQVGKVRDDLEQRVLLARTAAQIRNAHLNRAAFYLLWQAGLRLGEVEDLMLEDVNLNQRRIIVRRGKGMKDRTVYLTETTVNALEGYLEVRGPGKTEHVFLHRFKPLLQRSGA